jgi:hypothetical protein
LSWDRGFSGTEWFGDPRYLLTVIGGGILGPLLSIKHKNFCKSETIIEIEPERG